MDDGRRAAPLGRRAVLLAAPRCLGVDHLWPRSLLGVALLQLAPMLCEGLLDARLGDRVDLVDCWNRCVSGGLLRGLFRRVLLVRGDDLPVGGEHVLDGREPGLGAVLAPPEKVGQRQHAGDGGCLHAHVGTAAPALPPHAPLVFEQVNRCTEVHLVSPSLVEGGAPLITAKRPGKSDQVLDRQVVEVVRVSHTTTDERLAVLVELDAHQRRVDALAVVVVLRPEF